MNTFAQRVRRFGPPEVIEFEPIALPPPGNKELLVHIKAAGVGPWDALIRSGRSALPQPLPLTLGADFSGVVLSVGGDAVHLMPGDDVFGVTSARFTGAYAQHAVVDIDGVAKKPASLDFVAAACVPVVSVTAWKMLFEAGRLEAGQRVLIHGAAGSVGAMAVQLALGAGAVVTALARASERDFLRTLGVTAAYSYEEPPFEESVAPVDLVLDTVGGEIQMRSFNVLKRGGSLISIVSRPDEKTAAMRGVRAEFFVVDVKAADLERLSQRFVDGRLIASVGLVLPLSEARRAHALLEQSPPGRRGKIVLSTEPVN